VTASTRSAALRSRRPRARRSRRPSARPLAVLLAALLLATPVVAVLALTDGSKPSEPSGVLPLRVTSGAEIATGFAVGRDRVVTVAHVLDGTVKVGGSAAKVLRLDRRSDLALLAVRGITARPPAVAAAGAGDELRMLRLRGGRSSSRSVRVRRAIVAHVRAPGAERAITRPALELAARIEPGDSGAAVVSPSGALAGVVFAASTRRENTAYAVDASAVARLLARD
jgi:S1-C subfamily serine protease